MNLFDEKTTLPSLSGNQTGLHPSDTERPVLPKINRDQVLESIRASAKQTAPGVGPQLTSVAESPQRPKDSELSPEEQARIAKEAVDILVRNALIPDSTFDGRMAVARSVVRRLHKFSEPVLAAQLESLLNPSLDGAILPVKERRMEQADLVLRALAEREDFTDKSSFGRRFVEAHRDRPGRVGDIAQFLVAKSEGNIEHCIELIEAGRSDLSRHFGPLIALLARDENKLHKEKLVVAVENLMESGRTICLGAKYSQRFSGPERMRLARALERSFHKVDLVDGLPDFAAVLEELRGRVTSPEDWARLRLIEGRKPPAECGASIVEKIMPAEKDARIAIATALEKLATGRSVREKEYLGLVAEALKLGIRFPSRLDRECLKAVVEERRSPKVDGRPLAVVVHAQEDDNRAIEYSADRQIKDILEAGFRVAYFDIASEKELVTALVQSTKKRKADLIVICGHGSPWSVQLGRAHDNDSNLSLGDHDFLMNSKVGESLAKDGQVLLISCSTGWGKGAIDNLTNMLRKIFPQASPHGIMSPQEDVTNPRIKFDSDKRLVPPWGERTYQTRIEDSYRRGTIE